MPPLGQMINTQPSQQAFPDPNVASLVPAQGQPQTAQPQQEGMPQQPMTADIAKAALGNATYLASFLLPKKKGDTATKPPEDTSTEPKTPPQATEPQKDDKTESGLETRLTGQINDLKDQITNTHQLDEISRIRQELTDLLKEDGGQK